MKIPDDEFAANLAVAYARNNPLDAEAYRRLSHTRPGLPAALADFALALKVDLYTFDDEYKACAALNIIQQIGVLDRGSAERLFNRYVRHRVSTKLRDLTGDSIYGRAFQTLQSLGYQILGIPPEALCTPPGDSSGTTDKTPTQERINVGLRCETMGEGEAYFATTFTRDTEPHIFYLFASKDVAVIALSAVSCISVANDTGKLVSSEVLTFGVFEAAPNTWGSLLAGKSLSHALWSEAKSSFTKHGGKSRREEAPAKSIAPAPNFAPTSASLVQFAYERNDIVAGAPATYRHHTGPSKSSAIDWLKTQSVTRPSYFLVVETPEGTFARDIQGIFEE